MLGRREVTMSKPLEFDIVSGASADGHTPVAHGYRLGEPGAHRGPEPHETSVMADVHWVYFRSAYVVEVFRHHRA